MAKNARWRRAGGGLQLLLFLLPPCSTPCLGQRKSKSLANSLPSKAQPGAEMAASGRGLCRAVAASPFPAWRRAHTEAGGGLKPEYDAVVIGAGKVVKQAGPELRGGKAALLRAWRGGGGFAKPHCSLLGHNPPEVYTLAGAAAESPSIWQAGTRDSGAGSAVWPGANASLLWAWIFRGE